MRAPLALDGRAGRQYIGAMFTGLVAATGELAARQPRGPGARLRLRARFADGPPALGESVAVDGCCLSVAEILDDGFAVDATAETLARTTLGRLEPGRRVNLERSLRAGDRLGGHLVTGHVDGVATLTARRPLGEALVLEVTLPAGGDLARLVAEKGSIALNGVSMTVNAVRGHVVEVAVIPITQRETNLGQLTVGEPLNVEVDLIARYVSRALAWHHDG
jgi:riboflavin synthase